MSASGVLIGTSAVVVLIAIASGLQVFATQNLGSIGPLNEISVNSRGGFGGGGGGGGNVTFIVGLSTQGSAKLTPTYLNDLARQPGVQAVTPRPRLSSSTVRYKQFQSGATVYGIDPLALEKFGLTFQEGELDLGRWEVMVGANVGESFTDPNRPRDNLVDPIDLQGKTLTLRLTRTSEDGTQSTRLVKVRVTGVLTARGNAYDYNVFMRLNDFEELNAWQNGQRANRRQDGYSEATVLADDPSDVTGLTTQLGDDGFFAFSSQAILSNINSTFVVLQAFVGAVGVIALAIAGTGIANTLITAIYERTKEIGLMKAVGATDDQVMAVFLAEAGAIGGLGGLGGMLAGWLISFGANILVQTYYLPSVAAQSGSATPTGDIISVPLWLFLAVPIFAAGIGILAGWYPARRAAALDPVVALRSE